MNRYAKIAAAFALTCAVGLVAAQVSPPPASPAPAGSTSLPAASASPAAGVADAAPVDDRQHRLDAADLSSFFDGLVPFALKSGDVAGGVISVVKDGKLIFARGYGYADLETRTPPSPQTTLFRPGSTSKLFTWTAVMQQVEQGKLDLDKDVNAYLDFTIPPRDGKPITLRNIMTHTPGFEDTARGLLPKTTDEVNLEKYLKTHVPARIYAPGGIVAYSNYGCGVAGYIVQRVSGEPFADYIKHHIFDPLGMAHSSFAQPLPPALAPLMSKGYQSASDGKPQPFEPVDPAPAGALSSTATDMARFMIAQLQDGRFGDARILEPATAQLMHSPQHTAAPGLNGFDLGFYQEDSHGQRIIGHGGDTVVFHSDLHLMLDANVGVFMSFNSLGSGGGAHVIRRAVFDAFLDRYFPYQSPEQPTVASAAADAARVAGWYQSSRRNDSALRPLYLLGQSSVQALPDHTIVVSDWTDYAGKPLHWREVGPLIYRQVHGDAQLKFITGKDGDIAYWATDVEAPVFVFQRVPAARSLGSVGVLGGLALLALVIALLSWGVGGWVRRHYRHPLVLDATRRRTRLLSRLGVLALFVDVAGWSTLLIASSVSEDMLLQGTMTPWLYLLYVLGVLALLGALAVVVHAVRCWMGPRRGRWVLAGETLLALAAIYLGWFIVAFGMISFNVRY
ncbi:serine hydrolase domain-containing protein [Dyella sp.]|jgi:CubicO group peptidase (beta-lactamase class C family)|uniref:serine hydrolase domain-containing protein n=1 Tax=Dyella sp. TaxID=1869338 RepID=UPI002D7771AC|nr:serine hydrolase domain-containing protein [Dyella sp.]HET6430987.1 serine hydrolase domain-containing protein [Dyella sp.]